MHRKREEKSLRNERIKIPMYVTIVADQQLLEMVHEHSWIP